MKQRFCTSAVFAVLWLAFAPPLFSPLATADEFALELRSRQDRGDGSGRFEPVIQTVKRDAKQTAVIVCDMWHDDTCQGAAVEAIPPIARTIPPPGIQLPAQQGERLAQRVNDRKQRLEILKESRLAADTEIRRIFLTSGGDSASKQ